MESAARLLSDIDRLRRELERAVEQVPDALGHTWVLRAAVGQIEAAHASMERRLEAYAIEPPEAAAHFVVTELGSVDDAKVAHLLGVAPRTVALYRRARPSRVRKNRQRITIVARVVFELRGSMSPKSIVEWFETPSAWFGQHSPLQLIERGSEADQGAIIARLLAARGQADQAPAHPASRGAAITDDGWSTTDAELDELMLPYGAMMSSRYPRAV